MQIFTHFGPKWSQNDQRGAREVVVMFDEAPSTHLPTCAARNTIMKESITIQDGPIVPSWNWKWYIIVLKTRTDYIQWSVYMFAVLLHGSVCGYQLSEFSMRVLHRLYYSAIFGKFETPMKPIRRVDDWKRCHISLKMAQFNQPTVNRRPYTIEEYTILNQKVPISPLWSGIIFGKNILQNRSYTTYG